MKSLYCLNCRTELAPNALACPACGILVFSDTLKQFAADADAATARGARAAARENWSQMLALLPAHSQQHATIAQRLAETLPRTDSAAQDTRDSNRSLWSRIAGGAAAAAMLLVGKLKFLLLGRVRCGALVPRSPRCLSTRQPASASGWQSRR